MPPHLLSSPQRGEETKIPSPQRGEGKGEGAIMNSQIVEEDLYGRVCFDYFKGEMKGKAYLVRDDGYRDPFDVGNYFGTADAFAPVEKKLLEFAKSSKVLDVGCGPGRFALYLQQKGWDVTAIDNSPYIVNIAKERNVKNVILGSVEDVNLPKTVFDTILLFGNNIGIAGTIDEARKFLNKLFSLTAKRGRILLTSLNINRTKEKHHLIYQQANREQGKYIGEIKLRMEYDGKIGPWFPWLLIESETLTAIAKSCGWKTVGLLDEYLYGMVLEKED